jgi:hypothetical protein
MKGKAGVVILFVIAAIIGVIFLGPVTKAATENTGAQSVGNESITANVGSVVDLGGFDIDENSETVYGYNDTSGSYEVATAGTDYEMSYQSGGIEVLASSSLIEDGEEVKVSYDYQASGSFTTTIVGFIPVMLGTLVFAKLAMGITKEM